MTAPGVVQTVGPVVFDYAWWAARYPELATWCSPEIAGSYFDLATLYLDNSDGGGTPAVIPWLGLAAGSRAGGSPVTDIPRRQMLLGLLTSHIAALNAPLNGQASPTTVGRIASAGEGTVNVSFAYPEVAGAEWFVQTKYGAAYWAATARYRTARYYPGPQPFGRGAGFYSGRGRF